LSDVAFLVLMLCLLLASCGGGSSYTPPPTNPTNPYTFTLTASGVSPKELTVPIGTRVLFVNEDSRRHDMASDPHPDHTDCTEINTVGVLTNGRSRETSNLVTPKTCGFHDHDNPPPTTQAGNQWTGRIVVR
jgi:plastocyanin